MARLVTSGAEFRYAAAILGQSETPGHLSSAAIETTVVRSGGAAWKAAAHSQFASFDVTTVDADSYFARGYFRWAAAPVVLQRLINVLAGSQGQVRTIAGTTQVGLYDDNNALVGSASSALALDTWHRIEMVIGRTATRLELWIDGVQIASTTSAALGASTITQFQFGNSFPTASTDVVYFDDVGINDSTGGVDDGLPGPGKIVLLLPTADYSGDAHAGWNRGNGGTTGLFEDVNNTPPIAAPATPADYIADDDADATQTYTAETATYSSAGITAADRIKIVRGLAVIGDGATGATRSCGLKLDNNPSDTEVTATTPTGVAGAYPSNWITMRGTLNTSPSVTLGSPVRIRVRKNSANADVLAVALMGVYVEYNPAVNVDVPTAAVTVAGLAPTVTVSSAASTGSVPVTGQAPTPGVAQEAAVGAVTVEGLAPTSSVAISVPVANVSVEGLVPSSSISDQETVGVADIAVTGLAPTPGVAVEATTGAVTASGLAPDAGVGVTATTAQIAVEGLAPTLGGDVAIAVDTANIAVEGLAPTVSATSPQVQVDFGGVVAPRRRRRQVVDASVVAGTGRIYVQGLPPSAGVAITAGTGTPPEPDTELEDLELLLLS